MLSDLGRPKRATTIPSDEHFKEKKEKVGDQVMHDGDDDRGDDEAFAQKVVEVVERRRSGRIEASMVQETPASSQGEDATNAGHEGQSVQPERATRPARHSTFADDPWSDEDTSQTAEIAT
ncbi:hypothetical protein PInf_007635 [Phytophthora infestans]|nr:hypothetical protein PInf_007635 [Phytophthora infestans]